MFQCICTCKYLISCIKGHLEDVSVHAQSKHKKQYKKRTNRKQTKRKMALAYKKTHKSKTKYKIYLYIIPSLAFYFNLACINTELTAQSAQTFPFRTHTIFPTNLKFSLPLQNQFNTSTTLTIRHIRLSRPAAFLSRLQKQ